MSDEAPGRRDPYALTLETPEDFRRRLGQQRAAGRSPSPAPQNGGASPPTEGPRVAATETLARRAGALADEVDFPAFVAGLVHGTFDAIVDASIRQMEEFADLVSAVGKDVDQFTRENVTANQARDVLAQQHPRDLYLELPTDGSGEPRLRPHPPADGADEEASPSWLADYGLDDEPLTDDLIEDRLVPAARRQVGEKRLQLLATMVLLGMNRVVVRDGSISARVRFRAAARDRAAVDYATSQDPGGQDWGQRGSATYVDHQTMVSTVGVNVQAETDLKAELFGEVQLNFASDVLPLERFVDQARMTLLERHARSGPGQPAPPAVAAAPASAAPAAVAPPAVTTPPAVTAPPASPPAPQPVQGGGSP